MRGNLSEDQIQGKLKGAYQKKSFLPQLLDDDKLTPQEIEATYVNLMLIEKEDEKKKDNGAKREEKPYGSYEDINANKTSIDLDAIFDKGNKILIYGRAGIGKTTLCNYISYKWAHPEENERLWQDKFDYVFWLPLRRLNDKWKKVYPTKVGDYSLECFIKIYCLDQDSSVTVNAISKILVENKVLLILDGYDEIIHKYRCGDVIIDRVIDGAITIKNSDARIIMTSRPNAIDYDTKEKFDAEIENIGLKKENVYKYVDKFAFKEGVEKSQALSQFIKSHKRFETMVQIPINLFLVCWLFDNGGLDKKKVETSTDLYQQITISLMRRYLEKFDERYSKEKTINLYPEQIEHKCTEVCLALEQIAYLGVKAKTAILNENLIKQVMLGKIDNSDTILVDIKELGLMTAIGEGAQLIEKDYAFIHLTFRDYFAARYIVRILRSDDISKIKEICIFLNENKYDPAYEQVFLFVSGLVVSEFGNAQAIEYFWNIILNGRCDLNIKTQVQLAINCLEEGKCSNQIVGINEFKGIIKSEQLLKFDWFVDSLYRNVQVLNSLGLADTIVDMVSKPTSGLHAEPKTLKLLEKLEINDLKLKKKIRIALIPLLENRANFRAAEIIGKLNITDSKVELEEPLVTAILTLLKVRKDSYYLGSAVGELLKLMRIPLSSRAQKQIAEGIINLINEPAIKTRINAVSALEGLIITDPELLDLLAAKLISLLEDDSPALSFNIKDLLAILSKLDAKMKNIIAEYFISLLDKEDYFIRDRAISILGSIRPKDCDTQVSIAKKLILLLQSVNTNMYEVTPALKGLGIEDLEVKKALISELISLLHCDNPNFLVEQGLEALNINKGELLEEIIPTLNRLLKSSNEKKQIRGVKLSLKLNIANPDTREVMTSVLIKLLSSSEQDRQFEAVRLLLRLNISDPKEHNKILKAIVKTLITLLTKDKEARLDAAQRLSSLELIKDEQEKIHAAIIKSLISLLKVQDTNIRIRAAMILLKLNVTGAKRQKKIHAAIIKAFIPLPKNRWPIEWGLISLKELLSQWNRDNLELCKALTSALISLLEKSYGAKIRIEVLENIRIEVADLLVTLNTVVLEDQKILLNTLDSLLESKDRERRCKAAKMLIDSRIDFKSIAEFNIEEKVALALIPCLKSRSIWIYQGYEAAEVLVNLSNISSPEIQQKLIKELILLYKEDHMSYRFNGILKKLKFAKDKVVEELLSMATDNTPHAKGIDASIFNILRQLSKDDLELKSKIVNTLLEVLGDTHMQAEVIRELSSLDIADNVELQRAVILKLLSMLEMKQNSSVLEDIHYYRIPHALLKIKINNKSLQEEITQLLIEKVVGSNNRSLWSVTSAYIERCGKVGIMLEFKASYLPLLSLGVFVNSATTVCGDKLILQAQNAQIVFKLADKDLPNKIVAHFQQRSGRIGLPTEILKPLTTGRKWIWIEGIDLEVDKVISNQLAITMEDMMLSTKEVFTQITASEMNEFKEFLITIYKEQITKEHNPSKISKIIDNYHKERSIAKEGSQLLIHALQFAHCNPDHDPDLNKLIYYLIKNKVGVSAVDNDGRTVLTWLIIAGKLFYEDVNNLKELKGVDRTKIDNFSRNYVHYAVTYGGLEEFKEEIGIKGANSELLKTKDLEGYTPIERAIILGKVHYLEIFGAANGNCFNVNSERVNSNVMALAINHEQYEVLRYFLYKNNANSIDAVLAFEALVCSAKSDDLKAFEMISASFDRNNRLNGNCSISQSTADGETILTIAIESRSKKIIEYLVDNHIELIRKPRSKDHQLPGAIVSKEIHGEYINGLITEYEDKYDLIAQGNVKFGDIIIRNVANKGGGVKGIGLAGAMYGLEKIAKIKGWPDDHLRRVCGTSVGSIFAALSALGFSGFEAIEIIIEKIKFSELLDYDNSDELIKVLNEENGPLDKVKSLLAKKSITSGDSLFLEVLNLLADECGICTGEKFTSIMDKLFAEKTKKHADEITLGYIAGQVSNGVKGFKHFTCFAIDISTNQVEDSLIVMSSEDPDFHNVKLSDAVRASMSIPFVFQPKEISIIKNEEKIVYKAVDGGCAYNFPLDYFDKVRYLYPGFIPDGGEKQQKNNNTFGFEFFNSIKKLENPTSEVTYPWYLGLLSKYLTGNGTHLFDQLQSMHKDIIGPVFKIFGSSQEIATSVHRKSNLNRVVSLDCFHIDLLDFDILDNDVDMLIFEGFKSIIEKAGLNRFERASLLGELKEDLEKLRAKESEQSVEQNRLLALLTNLPNMDNIYYLSSAANIIHNTEVNVDQQAVLDIDTGKDKEKDKGKDKEESCIMM